MKQTAVEWLEEALIGHLDISERYKKELFKRAKEMEKDQQCQKVIDFLTWTNKIALENPMALETDHDDIAYMFLNNYYNTKPE
jgi:hypothetical protein